MIEMKNQIATYSCKALVVAGGSHSERVQCVEVERK